MQNPFVPDTLKMRRAQRRAIASELVAVAALLTAFFALWVATP